MTDRPLDSIPNSMMPSSGGAYDDETTEMLRGLHDDDAPQAGNDQEQADQYQEVDNEQFYQEEPHGHGSRHPGEHHRHAPAHHQMYEQDDDKGQYAEQFQEYYPQPNPPKSTTQRLLDIVKVDGVLMVLFFFLSLPVVNQLLLRFIPRLGVDGRMGILGLLSKTLVFGLIIFVLFFFDLV